MTSGKATSPSPGATTRSLRLRADLILVLTAVIWGSAFVAQRVAAQQTGAYFFNSVRFFIAVIALVFFSLLRGRPLSDQLPRRGEWRLVILAAAAIFLGSALQQAGLATTTAGNAGFITSLYVVIVPLILLLFFRRRLPWTVWPAAIMAVIGMLLLSTGGKLRLNPGDTLEFAGAFMWAGHVLSVDYAMQRMPLTRFAIGQFFFAAVFHLFAGLLFESRVSWSPSIWLGVAYVGLLSTAVGYTLQAAGQRYAPAPDAALILSLESVFAALFGFLLLQENLTPIQLAGCILIFAAVLLAQRPVKSRELKKRPSEILEDP